ncbi:MAG: DUF1080 domain-containing protein [Saprospiraceae bacterium]|nr:DUF1080 domain-containing protein [Saprospiraceae bacterium]
MKVYSFFALFMLPICLLAQEAEMHSIFNGKDLTGWQTPNLKESWKVEDGVLMVMNDEEKTGDILWTEKSYKDFIIKGEFKFGKGTVDSGFFMRSDHDQIQIGISGSLKRDMTCSPYIPGKGYPVEATGVADLLKLDDWNTIQVKAEGNHYTSWLNGEKVMEYTSDTATEMGPIGIQLHPGREMSIEYRNLMVAEL